VEAAGEEVSDGRPLIGVIKKIMSVIRAERQTVRFFEGLQVDGYRMPDGEFRVGIAGAGRVLGYDRNWLGRVLDRGGNTLKALQGLGFTEQTVRIVIETSRGDREAQTISLRDFNRLISYAVFDGKRAALALQLALTEVALNDFFRDAFGDVPLSIDEKRQLFYEAYAATISPDEWRQMDREEILRLALPGDEPPLRDSNWNQ
jgi:hypothetical protein